MSSSPRTTATAAFPSLEPEPLPPLTHVDSSFALMMMQVKRPGGRSNVLVHNLIDLSESPDREAAWSLQVVTAQSISAPPPGNQQGHHPPRSGGA